jgi:DNA-binding Lrp family transcriptional regulator
MGTITLDDRDRAVLERLREAGTDADVDSLAEAVGVDDDYLRDRLPELADNGLVARTTGDAYELTDDGMRTVEATSVGAKDDRIDTPQAVEERIERFDLRPDREEAVRNAFSFLHYWGEAFGSEIVDAVYSENPAGFESEAEWWDGFVRDRLAELPSVEPPASDDGPWGYADTPVVEKRTDDGRVAPSDDEFERSSVKFALERLDLDDEERRAVRRAFDRLLAEGTVTASEFRAEVYPENEAGRGSASEWWDDCLRPALEALPGVERVDEGEGAERWHYRSTEEGPMSTAPGAELPDEPFGPDDEG